MKWIDMSATLSVWFLVILFSTGCAEVQQPKLEDADAYINRGNAYVAQGRYDQAIDDYSKAIEINPRHAKAYSNRGETSDFG